MRRIGARQHHVQRQQRRVEQYRCRLSGDLPPVDLALRRLLESQSGARRRIDHGELHERSGDVADGGELGRAVDLVRFPGGGPVPDGLVVDAEGSLWVAIWGGGQVHRYAPDGELLAVLPVPVSQPTCPAFGGPGLDELYLTTAWEGMPDIAQRTVYEKVFEAARKVAKAKAFTPEQRAAEAERIAQDLIQQYTPKE